MGVSPSFELKSLRRLRFAVALEGITLLVLVLVATPLKHFGDMPVATKVMGTIHGVSFLLFLYVLIECLSAGILHGRAALRLFVGAMVPFGGLLNECWLAQGLGSNR